MLHKLLHLVVLQLLHRVGEEEAAALQDFLKEVGHLLGSDLTLNDSGCLLIV